MVPMGTHEWTKYINADDMERMIQPEGRVTAKAGLMITNPITLEMDEFPNWLRGNYMMMVKRDV
jgi:2-polyprenyl-3-methyl-5-hydroxy-6-metoxy-1,4-benzoquinol methylase